MQDPCTRSPTRISLSLYRIPSTSGFFKICGSIVYKISRKEIFAGPAQDLDRFNIFAGGSRRVGRISYRPARTAHRL